MAWYSAIAQESVSRISSCFSGLHDDVTSRKDMVRRLDMAVYRLGLAIEISDKLSVTYVSLLGLRKVIKEVWIEGKELLRTHKQLEGREEVGQQLVTSSSILGRVLTVARNNPIVPLRGSDKGYLSSSTVRKFEQYAELADKFQKDVQSAFLRRNSIISNPLLRLLFEWKTVGCIKKNGTSFSAFGVWTTRFEDRGVEAFLAYMYQDRKMPEKNLQLRVCLRLSESTDIIGTVVRCLQPFVSQSQFKDAAEFAIGELSQLATATSNLLELTPSRVHCLPFMQEFADINHFSRSDPICCLSNEHGHSGNNIVSSNQVSHIIPEEVSFLNFIFQIPLEKEKKCKLRGSSDASMSVMLPLTLKVNITLQPHSNPSAFLPELVGWVGSDLVEFGSKQNYRITSIRELLDTVGSTAMHSYLNRPGLTRYGIFWFSNHGAAAFNVRKPTARRSTKRKR